MKQIFSIVLLALSACFCNAQSTKNSLPPALAAIKEADLKANIFELAGDAFKGRRAGTLDELRAAAWVAKQAQAIGLEPAGDDGTYFQFYNLKRGRVADNSSFVINGKPVKLWKDIWVTTPIKNRLDGAITWVNSLADTNQNFTGKIVAMQLQAPTPLPAAGMSLWAFRYVLSAIRQYGTILRSHGAVAVIFVADAVLEKDMAFIGHGFSEGTYANDGLSVIQPRNFIPNTVPFLAGR